ncbi:MAG: 5'-nucleotidase, lipoprotein e(P4) family [Fusobacterium necrophorum]|nr:5'-nucleotidase, lipoprotein e(P4) family [Fusobacterium necrophorum]MDY2573936.1 5'-nucleotidase, lipoprotein e(P4) family [Fusobacterium necrophorum]MDY6172916.1 5'-nucleotidase, lipoprotein e(P4) family [Fusobacterium necrophorum]
MKLRNGILSTSMKIFLLGTSFFITACQTVPTKVMQEKTVNMSYNELRSQQNMLATNWYQTAGEAKALYIQGYNIAKERLAKHLKTPSKKPYSIVLDLDETVIDNSPYSAENILQGRAYEPSTWNEWVNKMEAKAVPGAKEFLEFANKNKVEIYYISDRTEEQLDATIMNLKKIGIPVQGSDHVLLKSAQDKSGKVNRREYVKNHTNLIMLFGDNLSDFDEFSKKSVEDRNHKVEELAKEFGSRFILFPNPMYGAFESAIYNGKFGDAENQIKSRKEALQPYLK